MADEHNRDREKTEKIKSQEKKLSYDFARGGTPAQ